jgi:hypothetical protein
MTHVDSIFSKSSKFHYFYKGNIIFCFIFHEIRLACGISFYLIRWTSFVQLYNPLYIQL